MCAASGERVQWFNIWFSVWPRSRSDCYKKKGDIILNFMRVTQSEFGTVITKSNVEFLTLKAIWHCVGVYQRKYLVKE